MKVRLSDPSKDRSIEIVRQLEQVFEPYRMMFKELNEGKESRSHHDISTKEGGRKVKMINCFT
jgi:hypothetical protein